MPDVSIIGTGALGATLARAFRLQHIGIKSLFNRSLNRCRNLAEQLDVETARKFPQNQKDLGRFIFITVPDDTIVNVSERLAQMNNDWSGYDVVHCSGNLSSSALCALTKKNARTATFHPLQTFNPSSDPDDFNGIYFDVEGEDGLLNTLDTLAGHLGAYTFRISAESKSYLHASAVMASNYLVALLYTAERIAQLGGMDAQQVRQALYPLVRQSLENGKDGKLSDILSGPIARGDSATVRQHLELLESNSDLFLLYQQLGRQALELAKRKGSLDSGQITELENLLSS